MHCAGETFYRPIRFVQTYMTNEWTLVLLDAALLFVLLIPSLIFLPGLNMRCFYLGN